MKPTLVILAAGVGSRYGGLKQMDPVGPDGSTIMDYSIYDAARAGFARMARHLGGSAAAAMVGYRLRATMSEHGSVARGVCELGKGGTLRAVREHLTIERSGDGAVDRGTGRQLTGDELVSMNFW